MNRQQWENYFLWRTNQIREFLVEHNIIRCSKNFTCSDSLYMFYKPSARTVLGEYGPEVSTSTRPYFSPYKLVFSRRSVSWDAAWKMALQNIGRSAAQESESLLAPSSLSPFFLSLFCTLHPNWLKAWKRLPITHSGACSREAKHSELDQGPMFCVFCEKKNKAK